MTSVIVLSGPSSSGKTALAKALQARLPFPAVHIEADRAFPDLPAHDPGWERQLCVLCAVDVLSRREASRPEPRPAGWAALQSRDIHAGMAYATTVDTSTRSPEECADLVVKSLGLSR